MEDYDLVVVGAGSGGSGAALAGARLGLSVLLVEKADTLGGTAVRGGVHVWEPGAGGTGIPFEIYRRLKRLPDAVGIYSFGRHCASPDPAQARFPGGESVLDPARRYQDSLRRHGSPTGRWNYEYGRAHWHGVVFEPEAYSRVVTQMLAETGRCRVRLNTTFTAVQTESGQIRSLRLTDGRRVRAGAFIDGTADGALCLACGGEALCGQEPRSLFGEPSAPAKAARCLNGVTLIYRITPAEQAGSETLPPDVPAACWWRDTFPAVVATHTPCGDIQMNMLPTMEGDQYLALGEDAAYAECRRRVWAHWHYLQESFPEFRRYRLSRIAPALGVRESRRIVGEYQLTEHDLRAGLSRQRHPDIITIADHALDRHGQDGLGGELAEPYGVPYRCLIPRGCQNLLIACRAAGFSAVAASSCRLSRTMMQLGQAAGTAAALAKQLPCNLPALPPALLRQALREQHVQLEWPTPVDLLDYLQNEDAA